MRHHSLSWIEAVERNRLVSVEKGTYVQIQQLDIPESGLVCYLKGFDTVKVFRTVFKNEYRYYTLYVSSLEQLKKLTYADFKVIHDNHWNIEKFHRATKQVCNIERFIVKNNHSYSPNNT